MGLVQHYPALSRPTQPVCSVCIANYNGVELLADCLDSVLGQQCGDKVEIIVHDDASTDDSVAWLQEHYPQVELLASADNVGFCISNNRMAEHARGQYLLLLNNDAALFPDALATLLEHATHQQPQGIITLPQFDWQTGELVDRGCLLDPFYNPVPNLDPQRTDVAMVIGACLWIPHLMWNELGGFPEWIESIGEDMYLCCHARLTAIPVQVSPTSGYRHRQGSSFGGGRVDAGKLSSTIRRRRLSERNKTFILLIFTPTCVSWLLLTIHLLALLAEGIVFGLVRWDQRITNDIYLNVFRSIGRDIHRLLDIRNYMQSIRTISSRNYFKSFTVFPRKLKMLFQYGIPAIRK